MQDKVEVSAQVKAITGCSTKSRLTLDRSRFYRQSTLNSVSIGQEWRNMILLKAHQLNWLTEEIPYSENFCIEARLESKNRTECCMRKL